MSEQEGLTRQDRAIILYLMAPERLLPKVLKEYADVLPKKLVRRGREGK